MQDNIIVIYLVLVEIYFGIAKVNTTEPFPLNVLSRIVTTSLNLGDPNSRVHLTDKDKEN